ncbi:SH3 domain-containing protein [Elizabethkingia meningoseptica]|nr:SH3 domain-containing protein [Elizabethkingia meningoseptica]MVW91113.1 SH3 domain-containing protein [Elizabethkingia meningoseptica]
MIMKKTIYYFIALNISTLYFAQKNTAAVEATSKAQEAAAVATAVAEPAEEAYENYIFHKEAGTMAKVFVDQTNVRSYPGLTGSVTEALAEGTSVKIIEATNVIDQIQARSARWYKIQYNGKEGYIWGANLSVAGKTVDGKEILFGISGTQRMTDIQGSTYDALKGEVKVFEKGKILASAVFDAGTMENMAGAELTVNKTKNFKNVSHIISVSVSGEACGIPTYEQNYFLKNDFLVALPILQSVGDAGVYYHSENYDFASKIQNQFVKKTEEGENQNPDNDEYKMDGFVKTSVYQWDGDQFLEMSSNTKKFKGKKLQ